MEHEEYGYTRYLPYHLAWYQVWVSELEVSSSPLNI